MSHNPYCMLRPPLQLGKCMRRNQMNLFLLAYVIFILSAPLAAAQSFTNPIVIDYDNIPESRPKLVDSIELGETEDVYGPWSLGNTLVRAPAISLPSATILLIQ